MPLTNMMKNISRQFDQESGEIHTYEMKYSL